jgi:hypothetical protein
MLTSLFNKKIGTYFSAWVPYHFVVVGLIAWLGLDFVLVGVPHLCL